MALDSRAWSAPWIWVLLAILQGCRGPFSVGRVCEGWAFGAWCFFDSYYDDYYCDYYYYYYYAYNDNNSNKLIYIYIYIYMYIHIYIYILFLEEKQTFGSELNGPRFEDSARLKCDVNPN